jgi:hypothetical protein
MPEGAMNLAKVLNICPMYPSFVQFPMAIVPPGLHTRSSSRATSSGRGASICPDQADYDIETGIFKRKRLGVTFNETSLESFRIGTGLRTLHQIQRDREH